MRNPDDKSAVRPKLRPARRRRQTEVERREILCSTGEVVPSFETLAAELRKRTKRRKQTPSETLLRAGRDER